MASTWPCCEHRLAHREADVLDRHLGGVDVVGLHEDLPLRVGAVGGGRAELLAFEVLRLGHAAALAADDREGRLVVDHEHRLDRRARIGVAELDQRVDVAEAHVVGAGRDAVDRLERARRGVDGDVEAFGLEVALVDGDHERRGRALELEVERELDLGLRGGGAGGERREWPRQGQARRGRPHVSRAPISCRYAFRRFRAARAPAVGCCSAKNMPNERASRDRRKSAFPARLICTRLSLPMRWAGRPARTLID